MEYRFQDIEQKWQAHWKKQKTFRAEKTSSHPKYYVLDMFPYPSGDGLHVGHPLGYISSDIVSRYRRHLGFNVLHPMGFDAFGLPAEQYAIENNMHPAATTEKNIRRYVEQLQKIGFAYDWERTVTTSDPNYYKWTQWIFLKLFDSWYDTEQQKARPIAELEALFATQGSLHIPAAHDAHESFTADDWKKFSRAEQSEILMAYRLAYQGHAWVNWCEALGTVLANDEVKDGKSERGGYPVVRTRMRNWFLRITAYADRLLNDLDALEWSDSMKEMQRNWIGKSEGARIRFAVPDKNTVLEVFSTRPDTIFGCSFLVLAPESDWVTELTTEAQQAEVKAYVEQAKNRSERERIANVERVSGVFTGSYAAHPFTGENIPVWISDYVLAGYGTGAVMAVPAHDSRDFKFAQFFSLPIRPVIRAEGEDESILTEAYEAKDGILFNSEWLNGLSVKDAILRAVAEIDSRGLGNREILFRLRDANFSRQRYWGEPFPIYYKDGIATALPESELPLQLPEMEDFKPTGRPESPLAKLTDWTYEGYPLETDTMPGFAGSSWYFLRYMDAENPKEFAGTDALEYWKDVDLYIGGTEHAVGHLLYSRFWHKVLHDYGYISTDEPFRKLVNQGMIQGRSNFAYRLVWEKYAEYKLWEELKKNTGEKKFIRRYKDGKREFDFFCKDANLAVEIKDQKNLDILAESYARIEREEGIKILMIPIFAALEDLPGVMKSISDVLNGEAVPSFTQHETIEYKTTLVSAGIEGCKEFCTPVHVKIQLVDNDVLDRDAFMQWREEYKTADWMLEDGKYICGWEIEKMSKSKLNVVNPDDICTHFGADTLRLYEMFLGPIEQHKPWNTNGIEGVHRFLNKFWKTVVGADGQVQLTDENPTADEYKALHKAIKKIREDIDALSLNTCVSAFMILLNELQALKCNKKAIFREFTILLSPFAPHLAEEIWERLGEIPGTVSSAKFPEFNPDYLVENAFEYPVSFNGKVRFKKSFGLDVAADVIEADIRADEQTQRWLEGKEIKKMIVVKGRIINVVL